MNRKDQARIILAFYKAIRNNRWVSDYPYHIEKIKSMLNAWIEAEDFLHACWNLKHNDFANNSEKWGKWDLMYLYQNKGSKNCLELALNSYDFDLPIAEKTSNSVKAFAYLFTKKPKTYEPKNVNSRWTGEEPKYMTDEDRAIQIRRIEEELWVAGKDY